MTLTLFGDQYLCKVALAAAALQSLAINYVDESDIKDEFLNNERIALQTETGRLLGIQSIVRYIATITSSNLAGGVNSDVGRVDNWVDAIINTFCMNDILKATTPFGVSDILSMMESSLVEFTFLAGDDLTIADLFGFASIFHYTQSQSITLDEFPSIARWYATLSNTSEIKNVYSLPAVSSIPILNAESFPVSCEVIFDLENPVQAMLSTLQVECTTYSHQLAYTVDEQAKYISHLPGILTKNLFVRDKKYGFYLITTKSDRDINFKNIATMLNLSGANLRLADEDVLKEKLGVTKGSVSPFAVMNDANAEVTFCIDKALLDADVINIHPLRCDRTTSITPSALLTVLQHLNHSPVVLSFAETTPGDVAKPSNPAPKHTASASAPKSAAPKSVVKAVKQESAETDGSGKGMKKETLLGLSVKKSEDFAAWYTQAITLSEMIDYSDISGCYILRPWSYFIWETIQAWFDGKIKELGVSNTYFPLFVSEKALNTEKEHVEGFAPEVAWVTRSGTSDLAEPIAIRPTSETIMYPFFAKWIRSHRDLPLEINQWCNVVRWEFKDATPFLRSREFLWQEGHTAHVSYEQAQDRVLSILELYRQVYEDLLACPVIKGMKTEMEKFAGGFHTTTVEAYICGSGRAIQGATSHNLGQGFGKMFKIFFEDDAGEKAIPWQTSWGLTTRTLGVCVMVHGDDKGLVLPPRVAPIQVIICPIAMKNVDFSSLLSYAEGIRSTLKALGIRADIDSRQNYTPGWKFNHWEQKGVPIRVEVGPRDVAAAQCRLVRRDTGDKSDIAVSEVAQVVPALLEEIQSCLFVKAKEQRDAKLVQVTRWDDFVPALNRDCLVLTPFCDQKEWEAKVKQMSREEALAGGTESETTATSVAAKTLCKPFDQPPLPEGTLCFVSGLPATTWVLWGRSY